MSQKQENHKLGQWIEVRKSEHTTIHKIELQIIDPN